MTPYRPSRDFGIVQVAHEELKRLIEPRLEASIQCERDKHFHEIYHSLDKFIESYPTRDSRIALIENLQTDQANFRRVTERVELFLSEFFPEISRDFFGTEKTSLEQQLDIDELFEESD